MVDSALLLDINKEIALGFWSEMARNKRFLEHTNNNELFIYCNWGICIITISIGKDGKK